VVFGGPETLGFRMAFPVPPWFLELPIRLPVELTEFTKGPVHFGNPAAMARRL